MKYIPFLLFIDILVGVGAPMLSYTLRFLLFIHLIKNVINIPKNSINSLSLFLVFLAAISLVLFFVHEKQILFKLIVNFSLIYLTSFYNLRSSFITPNSRFILKLSEIILFVGLFVATKLGYGERSYTYLEYSGSGFFHAANDTGLVVAMLIFLNVLRSKGRYIDLLWYCFIYLPVSYTLSTKTALLSFLIGFIFLLYKLRSSRKYLILAYPFLIYTLLVNIRYLVINTDFNGVFKKMVSYYEGGIGETRKFDRFILDKISLVGSDKILFIESDILDIIQLVGWLPSLIIVPILLVSIVFLLSGLKVTQLALFSLIVLHGFIAGHVFLSTQVVMIFVVAVLYLKSPNRNEQKAHNICST